MPKFTAGPIAMYVYKQNFHAYGVFYVSRYTNNTQLDLTSDLAGYGTHYFNASRCWSGYKDDQTIVQPKAIKVCLWRRVA